MLKPLIHSEGAPLALPGAISFTVQEIRKAHDKVTPVYDADGTVNCLEIKPRASATDICTVLSSCGIPVAGIIGDQALDRLGLPLRYIITPAPEIGDDIISLVI
ncbi:hypothetical protein KBD75_02395 [Candidatus Woesebacteria bacterium]|nr:hypothetical protein [Candidatus Woesebacteria bacterium]